MSEFKSSKKSKLNRYKKSGFYDKETVEGIINLGLYATVSFVIDEQPFAIPMGYCYQNEKIYLHFSKKSRLTEMLNKNKVCLSITLMDGIVISRSAFDHSFNYRSVSLFGKGKLVEDANEKEEILKDFLNRYVKDRWNNCRKPSKGEIKATSIISIKIKEASAKIRQGDPMDDKKDMDLPYWAGVIPITTELGAPIAAKDLKEGIEWPEKLGKDEG